MTRSVSGMATRGDGGRETPSSSRHGTSRRKSDVPGALALKALTGTGTELHLVERFTRTGPDVLQYEATVTNPGLWQAPWTAVVHLTQTDEAIFEYACHEGNIGMEGILAGHRAQEEAAGAPE